MPWLETDARPVVVDYKRETRPALLDSIDRKSVGEMTLCSAAFVPNYGAIISTAQLVVAVHKSAPYELRWRLGDKARKRTVRPGAIHITPVGVPIYMDWGDARPQVTALAIDQTMVLRIVEGAGMNPTTPLPTTLAIRDPMIRQLAEACERELVRNSGRTFAENIVTTLVTHIYRTYTSAGQPIPVKGGLTPKQTSRVLDYVRVHLSEDIGVNELAAEVGLSGNHFTETFKKTMGVTPYQYVLNRRIEKARELLRQSKLPLAKIAELVGFSSPTKLSAHFRKIVGIPPAQYRREAL